MPFSPKRLPLAVAILGVLVPPLNIAAPGSARFKCALQPRLPTVPPPQA